MCFLGGTATHFTITHRQGGRFFSGATSTRGREHHSGRVPRPLHQVRQQDPGYHHHHCARLREVQQVVPVLRPAHPEQRQACILATLHPLLLLHAAGLPRAARPRRCRRRQQSRAMTGARDVLPMVDPVHLRQLLRFSTVHSTAVFALTAA